MKKLPLAISAYTLCFTAIAFPSYADVTEKIEQSYKVNEGSEFSVSNINGSVKIHSWQQNEIKIVAVKEADSQAELDRMTIKFDRQGDQISVETKHEQKSDRYNRNSGSVTYEVLLPEHIKTTDIDLVNGSLVIERVGGFIDADLVNGSVKIKEASGNSKVQSVNGSIKVQYKQFAPSVSKLDLKTVNGSIKLSLPSEANAKVKAETMHGSLKSDFNLTVDKNLFTGKEMSGTIGTGEAQINLESVNGSIKIMNN